MSKLIYNSPLKKRAKVECPELNDICRPVFVLEKHLSVIRKGPTAPPRLEMYKFEESTMAVSEQYLTTPSDTGDVGVYKGSFSGDAIWQSWNFFSDDVTGTVNGLASGIAYPTYAAFYSAATAYENTLGTAVDGTDISNFYHPDKTPLKSGDAMIIPIDISVLH